MKRAAVVIVALWALIATPVAMSQSGPGMPPNSRPAIAPPPPPLPLPPRDPLPSGSLTLFSTEQQAARHCPADTVVWLNTPSGVYHFRGERWYGRTKHGAYVCEREADRAGDRATRNGQ